MGRGNTDRETGLPLYGDEWEYEPKTAPEIADLFQIWVDRGGGTGGVYFAGIPVFTTGDVPRKDGEKAAQEVVAVRFASRLRTVLMGEG
jgi:hypothetical protein